MSGIAFQGDASRGTIRPALAPPAEHLVHFAPEVAVKKKTQMGNMLAGLFLLIVVALIVLAGWAVFVGF